MGFESSRREKGLSNSMGVTNLPSSYYRPDLQGVRALAVSLVLVFHLWPNRVSGGFVGVDVFFVISGFLITGHILRELSQTGSLKVTEFWARRIRRLLPAAYTVLAVTSLAVFFLLPKNYWKIHFQQIAFSGVYLQNWALRAESVDYMAKDAKPTAVQHFWSLSIEEQFYLVWPILIIFMLYLARKLIAKKTDTTTAVAMLLAGLTVVSLLYSIFATNQNQATAYFATTTRVWEFAVGGLAACWHPSSKISDRLASLLSWLGVFAIVFSALRYSGDTRFPGYTAIIPVIGTVALLWFGNRKIGSSTERVFSYSLLVWIGGISYAIYLWHWPLVVIIPILTGRDLSFSDKILIGLSTILLAYLSTRFIETPLRRGRLLRTRLRAFIFTAVGAGAFVFVAFLVGNYLQAEQDAASEEVATVATNPCIGPNALESEGNCDPMGAGDYLVPPETVSIQNTDPLYPNCQQGGAPREGIPCHLGVDEANAAKKIVLAGDSHATQWFSGFDLLGREMDWSVTTFTKASCPISKTERYLESEQNRDDAEACNAWNDDVLSKIVESDADLVVLTSYQSAYEWVGRLDRKDYSDPVDGFAEVYKEIADSGKEVRVIKAVPRTIGTRIPDCLVANGRDATICGMPRERAIPVDLMALAVERLNRDDIQLMDLDDQFCDSKVCYPVIGNIVVYRDYSHISSEYATALAPWIKDKL